LVIEEDFLPVASRKPSHTDFTEPPLSAQQLSMKVIPPSMPLRIIVMLSARQPVCRYDIRQADGRDFSPVRPERAGHFLLSLGIKACGLVAPKTAAAAADSRNERLLITAASFWFGRA